ncbi:type I DNA topoisomerase [candidate division GN15 bacterium]|nr:type I DNA topoisomerase [candidate division GN15 bacterium]
MKLIVVESPAKAKTISRFLGSDYKVVASYGHVRDLPGSANEIPEEYRDKGWARMGVDVDNGFTPIYIIPRGTKKYITQLKKELKKADELLLATDEDREGESISWHLVELLEPKVPVKRITFHEITKGAIEEALANPRDVDMQLVRAQESRRILDRLYGYSLSPVLWKRVRTKLSAGRVQSVAVRLVVEREEERQAFNQAQYWDIEALLSDPKGNEFTAKLFRVGERRCAVGKDFDPDTGELKQPKRVVALDEKQATELIGNAQKALPWEVTEVERKQTRQRPAPPFTTSTMQQAAGSRLGMSPRKAMRVAQQLYEGIDLGGDDREGLITYMRTDSTVISEKALADAKSYITNNFGDKYHTGERRYRTKSQSAQEAHEAIRPTEIKRDPKSVARYLDKDQLRLYTLIWERAVASQMADAILDKTTVDITAKVDGRDHIFRCTGSVIRFDGYLKVAGGAQKDTILPEMNEGDKIAGAEDNDAGVRLNKLESIQRTTSPPARYTEASLVKKLEEEGIGRPSTYAPTISLIQQREYVNKKGGALVPTFIGMAVVNLLRNHFGHYIDLKFTAQMEEDLDAIASGRVDPEDFLSQFYFGDQEEEHGLTKDIEEQLPQIDYPAINVGEDPETGEPLTVRIGRNFVYVQRGEGGDGNTATVPVDLLIDELDPAKARELIKARKKGDEPLGTDPDTGKKVYALVGPYGPYVQLGETGEDKKKPKRVSLPKNRKIEEIDLDYALRLLSLPRELGTDPDSGKKVTAGLGPYGPYVERARTYRRLPSVDRAFEVTLEEALEMLAKGGGNTKEVLKELGKHPETEAEIQVMTGRYGPYVTDGKVNASLSGWDDPTKVTMEEAVKLLAEAATKKKTKRPARRKTTRRKKS